MNVKVARALNVNARVVETEILKQIDQTNNRRSGVKYPNLPNQSSAPGEAPAFQSGRLRNSIAVVKRATPDDLVAETGPRVQSFPDAYYAAFLEYGTRKMQPRPYMRPAAAAVSVIFRGTGIKVA
jgi:HK97 gp10 family phage protein